MSDFLSITLDLLNGFLSTLQLFGLTLLFSLPLGLIICFGSMSKFKPLRWLVRTFVWIIRGTPLLLQLIIVYYGPGLILNTGLLPRFSAALLAFVINYSCYFSEIYRGGIESISKGQYEAVKFLVWQKHKFSSRLCCYKLSRELCHQWVTKSLLL